MSDVAVVDDLDRHKPEVAAVRLRRIELELTLVNDHLLRRFGSRRRRLSRNRGRGRIGVVAAARDEQAGNS
jgi:hypothetical protein